MERGKSFDDHGGAPFLKYGFRGWVMKIVSQFGRLALMFCFPFDNVNRDHQRLTTSKRGYREKTELTEYPPKTGTLLGPNKKK